MHRRNHLVALVAAVALAASGCGAGSGDASAAQTRTVQVDYKHDEFATSLFEYFPRRVEVRQGDTIEFKQAWAGAPHSVTMGTLVNQKLEPILALLERIERTGDLPNEEPEEFKNFDMPWAIDHNGSGEQNAAQPCYVDEDGFDGTYPGDTDTPCPKRPQPEFTGRQAIYSSGIIPYEGVGGNTFRVKVADDAKPGTFSYYCNVHGPLQWGQVVVKEKTETIPSRDEVARQARKEAERKVAPMLRNWKAAKAGKTVEGGDPGDEVRIDARGKNLVGVPTPFFENNTFIHGVVNEFVPRNITAKVGEKVTWTFISGHTLSFNVPKYFPIFTVAPDGTVAFNKKTGDPEGWPGPPEDENGGGSEGEGEEGGAAHEDKHSGGKEARPEDEGVHVDAGPWDGKGFRSTGIDFADNDTFSVTFTKPGSYPFACLVHPQMVGKLVVKA